MKKKLTLQEIYLKPLPEFIKWVEYCFILTDTPDFTFQEALQLIIKRTNFGQRKLQLGDFVACKDGEPIEKPKLETYCIQGVEMGISKEYKQYQEAQKSVLFDGWVFGSNGFLCNQLGGSIGVMTNNEFNFFNADSVPNWNTIEDLIRDFTLTPSKPLNKQIEG